MSSKTHDDHYTDLVKQRLREEPSSTRRKRRRVKEVDSDSEEFETVDLGGVETLDGAGTIGRAKTYSDMNYQDIDLETEVVSEEEARQLTAEAGSEEADDAEVPVEVSSSDGSDFEDIDLDAPDMALPSLLPDSVPSSEDVLTIAINNTKEEPVPSKRNFIPITKEERESRYFIHKAFVIMMVTHGALRNRWCNDYELALKLKNMVSKSTMDLLNPSDPKLMGSVKSRRFLDGLQKLLKMYKFRVCSEGIIKKNWNELPIVQKNTERNVTLDKFRHLVLNLRGSRDIASQGFVALLRALGLNARLIFSLQPPDFTSITANVVPKVEQVKPSAIISRFSNRNALLQKVRSKGVTASAKPSSRLSDDYNSYPMFWVEIWNKYTKKWISVDCTILGVIESCPMRRKSKFEIALKSNVFYVLAYDKYGGVTDVTRRYTQSYNSKVVKKRIGNRSELDEHWYAQVLLNARSSLRRKPNKTDILEMKEFHDRDLTEGMPNNIVDFKNHPLYVLESQLKQNEVIYPKDSTSKCGTFRIRRNNSILPVYKRSHVHSLRSARGWYMRGRVLKMGEHALKLKKKKPDATEIQDDEVEDTRLYAEFQTKMYQPVPIVNGTIPKNTFGNIDLYTPEMLPENGYFVELGVHEMKVLERAARILEIDFARAIVAFDFKNTSRKVTRVPKATEGGIVIDKQYAEAFGLILEALEEEDEERKREMWRLNSFKNWKYFLAKLRISERLNRNHGTIEDDKKVRKTGTKRAKASDSDESDADSEYSVYDETSGSEEEVNFTEGGFLASNQTPIVGNEDDGGGFLSNDVTSQGKSLEASESELQGFEQDDDNSQSDTGGGFFVEKDTRKEVPDMDSDSELLSDNSEEIAEDLSINATNNLSAPDSETKSSLSKDNFETEEDLPGGFVIESPGHSQGDSASSENIVEDAEDLPDELFTFDSNGELVYNPKNGSGEGSDFSEEAVEDSEKHQPSPEPSDSITQNVAPSESSAQKSDVADTPLAHSNVAGSSVVPAEVSTPAQKAEVTGSEQPVSILVDSVQPENTLETAIEVASSPESVATLSPSNPEVVLDSEEEKQLIEEEQDFGFQYDSD